MSFCIKISKESFSPLDIVSCFPWSSIAFICFLPWSSIIFVCFSQAFPKEEYVNLAFFYITLLPLEGSISSPVRYSYLSILPNDNADIFTATLLISYCSFSFLILSSIFMIDFYILSKRFFLKRETLSDGRVSSIIKDTI